MQRIIVGLLIWVSVTASAQQMSKHELLDVISSNICQELTENNVEIKSDIILGLYMLKHVNKYKDQIAPFYENKDNLMDNEALGEELGKYMGLKCPEVFISFWEEEINNSTPEFITVSGTITQIDYGQLLTLKIREKSGKSHQLVLLNNFPNAYLLTDDLLVVDENVEVTYYVDELYDAQIKRFVNFNVITDIINK